MQRLKNRAQYQAAMAGGTISRTAHFVLHRLMLDAPSPATAGPDSHGAQALFAVRAPWMGAVVPKRWAKRAVTRNGIKRQIYSLSEAFEARLPPAAHVVRLRTGFAKEQFPSAWSEALKKAVRTELLQLFSKVAPLDPSLRWDDGKSGVIPAQAGIQGREASKT